MLVAQLSRRGRGLSGCQRLRGEAPVSGWAAAWLASGTLVDGCGGLSVSSPRMPSICGATVAGTSGAAALSYPVLPDDRRYFEIGVEKADWTWATVPETGIDRPVAEGVADGQALLAEADVTWAMVAGVGPKRWANCAGVRKWRYSGEPGRRSPGPLPPARRDHGA